MTRFTIITVQENGLVLDEVVILGIQTGSFVPDGSFRDPLLGTAGILQLCNTARHNVVIIYVPIYHAF